MQRNARAATTHAAANYCVHRSNPYSRNVYVATAVSCTQRRNAHAVAANCFTPYARAYSRNSDISAYYARAANCAHTYAYRHP